MRGTGRIKFRLFDNLGNLIDDKITSSKFAIRVNTKINHLIERQVMRFIGEHIVAQRAELSDEQRAIKEKEGLFNMEESQAQIDSMMANIHGPPAA